MFPFGRSLTGVSWRTDAPQDYAPDAASTLLGIQPVPPQIIQKYHKMHDGIDSLMFEPYTPLSRSAMVNGGS